MSMSLSQLPINLFDLVVIVVLAAGIYRGRKHGMSEELLSLLTWLAILLGCATVYEPGAELIGQFTNLFSPLTCYLIAYLGGAVLIFLLFMGIKRVFSGKLLGSDIFGRPSIIWAWGRASCVLAACCWRLWRS